MILVIADDISGAAELAGIAASRGLRAEVHTQLDLESTADLIALDTNTRSQSPAQAAATVTHIARQATALKPSWIYKKTDSALRGNIQSELNALAAQLGKTRVIFIPANPGKRRTIIDGEYFINDVPLHQTALGSDPEYPIKTSNVERVLKAHARRASETESSLTGSIDLNIPNVVAPEELRRHAASISLATIPAGAAEFFTAILETRTDSPGSTLNKMPDTPKPCLFLCGSLAAWEQGIADIAHRNSVPITTLGEVKDCARQVCTQLKQSGVAMLATGPRQSGTPKAHERVLQEIIEVADQVLRSMQVQTLCTEGGATTQELARTRGWSKFRSFSVPSLIGVGCLQPLHSGHAPMLMVKPGSYPWPKEIWEFGKA